MSADDDGVIEDFRIALSSAREAIRLLSELSEHDDLDVQWSSQVARAQTKIADSIRTCKSRLRDISDLVEYEGRCETTGGLAFLYTSFGTQRGVLTYSNIFIAEMHVEP